MADEPTTPLCDPDGCSFDYGPVFPESSKFSQPSNCADFTAVDESVAFEVREVIKSFLGHLSPSQIGPLIEHVAQQYLSNNREHQIPCGQAIVKRDETIPTCTVVETTAFETSTPVVEALQQQPDLQTIADFDEQDMSFFTHLIGNVECDNNVQCEGDAAVATQEVAETFQGPPIPDQVNQGMMRVEAEEVGFADEETPTTSTASGSRRARNNVASKKSNQKREQKQIRLRKLAKQLEVGNKALEQRCLDLETLIDRLKAFLKQGKIIFVPSNN